MHPSSGRRTPRPGGSKGPSPRSRRCRTCPSRPDIQAAQVLPRSQPSARSGRLLPGTRPVTVRTACPCGQPPEPVSPSHIPPRRPPSGRTTRRRGLSTGSDDMPRARRNASETEVIPGTIPDFRPAAAPERRPREGLPSGAWRRAAGLAGRCGSRDLRPRHSRVPQVFKCSYGTATIIITPSSSKIC